MAQVNAPLWQISDDHRTRYNGTATRIPQSIVVIPDSNYDRGVRPPNAAETITQIVGVAYNPIDPGTYGDIAGTPGDIAVCIARTAVTRGDRVIVSTTAGYLGYVESYSGTGTAIMLGTALTSAGAGETLEVSLNFMRLT